jgi:hypothetical protein
MPQMLATAAKFGSLDNKNLAPNAEVWSSVIHVQFTGGFWRILR